jgi:hypothetical protein
LEERGQRIGYIMMGERERGRRDIYKTVQKTSKERDHGSATLKLVIF